MSAGGCSHRPDDEGWGRSRRPVIYVSWDDAQSYVGWLSSQTGASYRLLSESEWEYAARAGSSTAYSWGNQIGSGRANCGGDDCGDQWDKTAPVGSFSPNAYGLHDMHGNLWEWVQDCWNGSYKRRPVERECVAGGWLFPSRCSRRFLERQTEVPPLRVPHQEHLRSPLLHHRFSCSPDAHSMNRYLLTSFWGFQGGVAPLGPALSLACAVSLQPVQHTEKSCPRTRKTFARRRRVLPG